jgi:nucleoside-triphosphatase THEP1
MLKNNHTFPWGVYIGDFIDNNYIIPLCLDSNQGGFCVLFDEASEAVSNNFIENVALKLFEVIPLGGIEVDIFDFGRPRFMKLSALKKANLYHVSFSKNRASDRFDTLDELKNDRLHNLLSFDAPTLSEYNKLNNETEKFHLLLINLDDFPDEMSSPQRIKNFFNASSDAGFYTILFGAEDILQSKSKAMQEVLKRFDFIEINSTQFKISKEIFAFSELLKNFEFEYINDNKEQILKQLLHQWESVQENDNEQDFLSIPIGNIGREKLYFNMGLKSQNYHAFIAGMTGMGKTNLLNNIIVNISQNYTLKEIEIYLMDYKPAGAEFMIFKNHPNCKKLFLENEDPTPAFEMLQEFQEEMYRRGEILNGKSIDEYNTQYPQSILPRKILIIDEVQRMFSGVWKDSNSFNALVEDIIKAGRSYGLHLILTTQSLKQINMKDSIMGQISLKLSFRLSDTLEAMKVFKDNQEAIKKVVKLEKYQFIYSDFAQTVVAKADYLEKDKIEQILKNLRSTRLNDEFTTPLLIKKSSDKERMKEIIKEQKKNRENFIPKYGTEKAKELLEKLAKIEARRKI